MKTLKAWVIRLQMRRNARLIERGMLAEAAQRRLQARMWLLEAPQRLVLISTGAV